MTADTLRDHMRARIERVYGCPVTNRYGSRELGDIAGQCSAVQGLHVFPWANYVEVVDDAGRPVGPGEEGELAVTSLINRAMPLIRYRIGDRGILARPGEGCSCGRPGQVLERITGAARTCSGAATGRSWIPGSSWVSSNRSRGWGGSRSASATSRTSSCRSRRRLRATASSIEEIERTARTALGAGLRGHVRVPLAHRGDRVGQVPLRRLRSRRLIRSRRGARGPR